MRIRSKWRYRRKKGENKLVKEEADKEKEMKKEDVDGYEVT